MFNFTYISFYFCLDFKEFNIILKKKPTFINNIMRSSKILLNYLLTEKYVCIFMYWKI